MPNSQIKKSVLIMTGMHRSGTSFTASLLQSAGLDIGQKLIESDRGNIRGFFENISFVEFHQMVLRSQGLDHDGWTLQENIPVTEQNVVRAQEIVADNSTDSIWGWKDPRTTLFLDFWQSLLPEANFLLIYRSPWEVVDSLYRRGDEIFAEQPELAVKLWMHYNKKIIDFYDRFSERCLLVSVYNAANQTKTLVEAISTKFHLDLVAPSLEIYERSLFSTQVSESSKPTLINYYFPEALAIYQELNQREVIFTDALGSLRFEDIENTPKTEWAFQDWRSIRHLEQQVKSLNSELERFQFHLQQIQKKLKTLSNSIYNDFDHEED